MHVDVVFDSCLTLGSEHHWDFENVHGKPKLATCLLYLKLLMELHLMTNI